MATNKHAIIRYQALDKCFSNWYKKFDMMVAELFVDRKIDRKKYYL